MMSEDTLEESKSTANFAAQTFTELHQAIVAQEPAARIGEIEAIHAMRVGIRRLRVALSNFSICFPKENRRQIRTKLENLANALGGVRNLDLTIETLEKARLSHPLSEQDPIIFTIQRLRLRRRRQLQRLFTYLDGEEYANFRLQFSILNEVSDAPVEEIKLKKEEKDGQAA